MSTVEVPPSRVKRLESGLGIGMSDSIVPELKSHSVGNLSSVSVKSLGVSPPKDKGDVPSDQDKGEVPDDDGKDENTGMVLWFCKNCFTLCPIYSCSSTKSCYSGGRSD